MDVRSPRQKAPGGDRALFQGTAAEVLGDIRRYADLGVSHFVFDPVVPDLKLVLANMERFAHEVRPKVGDKKKTARKAPDAKGRRRDVSPGARASR